MTNDPHMEASLPPLMEVYCSDCGEHLCDTGLEDVEHACAGPRPWQAPDESRVTLRFHQERCQFHRKEGAREERERIIDLLETCSYDNFYTQGEQAAFMLAVAAIRHDLEGELHD